MINLFREGELFMLKVVLFSRTSPKGAVPSRPLIRRLPRPELKPIVARPVPVVLLPVASKIA
jgi:hypothetical protein